MICMDKGPLFIKMEEFIKDLSLTIKDMATVSTRTQMVEYSKECGKMGSNTVKEPLYFHQENQDRENGLMGNVSNGLMETCLISVINSKARSQTHFNFDISENIFIFQISMKLIISILIISTSKI